MGSLTAGWDSSRTGKPPKGFEDFKEPISPRLHAKTTPSPFGDDHRSGDQDRPMAGGPPNLARKSAPPPMHGASAVQRYLQRASSGSPPPVSPRVGTPRAAHKMTLMLGEEECSGMPLSTKEKWCARVESSRLNERPDEEDRDSWAHGSFKVSDAAHSMHLPSSPRAAAAENPFASERPTVMVGPAGRHVTVERVPDEAMTSLYSSGL